jgi:hypothetical protein
MRVPQFWRGKRSSGTGVPPVFRRIHGQDARATPGRPCRAIRRLTAITMLRLLLFNEPHGINLLCGWQARATRAPEVGLSPVARHPAVREHSLP